jgi:hypothetical protein
LGTRIPTHDISAFNQVDYQIGSASGRAIDGMAWHAAAQILYDAEILYDAVDADLPWP